MDQRDVGTRHMQEKTAWPWPWSKPDPASVTAFTNEAMRNVERGLGQATPDAVESMIQRAMESANVPSNLREAVKEQLRQRLLTASTVPGASLYPESAAQRLQRLSDQILAGLPVLSGVREMHKSPEEYQATVRGLISSMAGSLGAADAKENEQLVNYTLNRLTAGGSNLPAWWRQAQQFPNSAPAGSSAGSPAASPGPSSGGPLGVITGLGSALFSQLPGVRKAWDTLRGALLPSGAAGGQTGAGAGVRQTGVKGMGPAGPAASPSVVAGRDAAMQTSSSNMVSNIVSNYQSPQARGGLFGLALNFAPQFGGRGSAGAGEVDPALTRLRALEELRRGALQNFMNQEGPGQVNPYRIQALNRAIAAQRRMLESAGKLPKYDADRAIDDAVMGSYRGFVQNMERAPRQAAVQQRAAARAARRRADLGY